MHRRLLVEEVDGLLSLTAGGLAAARAAYPELADAPGAVTPHGHYRDDYDFTAARDAARAERGVAPDATLVVSVGMIRAYKNIPDLVRTVAGTGDPALVLAIAGRPAGDLLADEIRSAAADDSRIVLDLAFQSDVAIASWLRAADLVVLPYRAIQNSGSAILALSADRPVVVPALGAMRELQAAVGEDWVRCYEGEFDAQELERSIRWAREPRPERAPLDRLDWNAIADATVAFYREVRGESHAAPPTAIDRIRARDLRPHLTSRRDPHVRHRSRPPRRRDGGDAPQLAASPPLPSPSRRSPPRSSPRRPRHPIRCPPAPTR